MTKKSGEIDLRFPIGKFKILAPISDKQVENWITEIELFPTRLEEKIKDLSETSLKWKYRPDGWTIKQVIHHCADSHMNSFIRFKLCLTEDTPTIKPYFEDRWSELPDVLETNISESIKILEGLHSRWTHLLKSLTSSDLKKEFIHPEHGTKFSIDKNIGLYAWHSNHHLSHIDQAIKGKGKYS